jgi:hypothetical protein
MRQSNSIPDTGFFLKQTAASAIFQQRKYAASAQMPAKAVSSLFFARAPDVK